MASGQLLHVLHYLRRLGAAGSDTGQTDALLLERFVARRDGDAFALLVDRHGPMVYGVCRRLLPQAADAADAFQATFLILARKAATIRLGQAVAAWLHEAARHVALRARVDVARRRVRERQVHEMTPRNYSEPLDHQELRALLDQELAELPAKYRTALVLCDLEGRTHQQAAQELGCPAGSVSWRLSRARDLLRQRLTRRGITLSTATLALVLSESTTAAVPVSLAMATVRVATARSATLSANVAAWTEAGAKAMSAAKVKSGLTMLLTATVLGLAVGVVPGHQVSPDPPLSQDKVAPVAQATDANDRQAKTDAYGDPLPEGGLLRLGTVRQRHAWNTTCAAFTPDSKSIIVGDMGGRLVYWDVTTGKQLRSLRLPGEGVCSLALSADGTLLGIGSWGKVRLWNPTTGAALAEWETPKDQVLRIAFAPGRKTIALGYYGKVIELWDVDTGKKRHTLEGHAGIVNTFAFAPDGKTLASGGWQDPNVRIWDVTTGKQLRAFAVAGLVRAVTGPNGESRTSPGDVLSVAFSPDGKTLATCANGTPIRFWDPETGKRLRESEPPAGFGLTQLRYLDRKRLASIGAMDLRIWDAETGKMLRKAEVGQRFMGNLSVSPDGKLLATSWQSGSNTIDLWDADTVKPLHNFIGHRTRVVALTFAKGGQTLFSGSNMNTGNPIYEWDLASCKPIRELGKPPSGGASDLVLSPDRQSLFACGFDLHQFDVATGKEARAFKGHTNAIEAVSLSADGKTLASACFYDHTIRLWDPATGKERLKIELNQDWPCPAVLSPGGEVVVSGGFRDGKLRMWETASGKILREMATPHAPVSTIAFSPDGKTLAAAGFSRSVSLHDPATGKLLREIAGLTSSWCARVAFSPDGRTLAVAGNDNEMSLWELTSAKRRGRFAGHAGPACGLAFSPDGRRLASGSDDTTILVWDLAGSAIAKPLSAKDLNQLWIELGGEDAAKAYRAIWTLATSPRQALPFFEQQLKPTAVPTADVRNQFTQLITDLDSDEFATRQKAGAQLAKLGPAVRPIVRQALKGEVSTEVRRQLEKLLRRLEEEEEADWHRTVRVLEALEHMATPDARQFMQKLSSGAPEARLTQEAKAALARLK